MLQRSYIQYFIPAKYFNYTKKKVFHHTRFKMHGDNMV